MRPGYDALTFCTSSSSTYTTAVVSLALEFCLFHEHGIWKMFQHSITSRYCCTRGYYPGPAIPVTSRARARVVLLLLALLGIWAPDLLRVVPGNQMFSPGTPGDGNLSSPRSSPLESISYRIKFQESYFHKSISHTRNHSSNRTESIYLAPGTAQLRITGTTGLVYLG